MEASDYSITEITFSMGFDRLDTIERVFKKIAGMTTSRCQSSNKDHELAK